MSASGSSKHTTRRQQEAHSLDLVQRVIISFLIGLFLAPSPPCLPPTWQSVVIKIFRSSGLRGYEGSSAVGFCDGRFRLVSGGGEVWVLLGWVVGALCTAAVDCSVGFCDGRFRLVSGGAEVWVLLGWVVGALCAAAVDCLFCCRLGVAVGRSGTGRIFGRGRAFGIGWASAVG